MNPQTKQQLNAIIETLESIQQYAPTKTTYSMGRTESSVSMRLLSVISDLKALADDEPVTERKPEPVATTKTSK